MFRLVLVVAALAACSSSPRPSLAWPKLHEADPDGGESLAPHTARAVAAIEKSEEPKAAAAPAAAAPTAAVPAAPTGAAPPAAPAVPVIEDPIITDDIIIEIDD